LSLAHFATAAALWLKAIEDREAGNLLAARLYKRDVYTDGSAVRSGKPIGTDLTDELTVVHANVTQAGVETVEFIEGYPEELPLPNARIAVTRGGEPTIEHACANCFSTSAAQSRSSGEPPTSIRRRRSFRGSGTSAETTGSS